MPELEAPVMVRHGVPRISSNSHAGSDCSPQRVSCRYKSLPAPAFTAAFAEAEALSLQGRGEAFHQELQVI